MKSAKQSRYDASKHLWENKESLDKYLNKLKEVMYERRSNLQTNTPVELAIRGVITDVEKLGADESLTSAVMKIQEAFNLVADYIDHKQAIGEWPALESPQQKTGDRSSGRPRGFR